ncbi:MAG: hydantoinase/oxoprolinase N-terminal domain-containing protein, partial [Dehalococcoidia bacterium]|nr:hydantoinase/oxoprolinase N-terminal domain-containing protein [Dehalococcoidia bacterium]
MYTIDIDIGGTFTDGFFTGDGRVTSCKVPTTPHDLTVCFVECIEEGASNLGVSLVQMLRQTAAIRLSTTIGTNAIITNSGPRIGLVVTKGYEQSLYSGNGMAPVVGPILQPDMVVGVEEEIGLSGEVASDLQGEALLEAVRNLVNQGARMIVVSLRNASANPAHERWVKKIV